MTHRRRSRAVPAAVAATLILGLVLPGCRAGTGSDAAPSDGATGQGNGPAESAVLEIGIFPFVAPARIDHLYGELVAELGEALESRVRLQTASTFERFSENLRAGVYDVALVQPFELVEVVDELGFEPLARVDGLLQAIVVGTGGTSIDGLAGLAGRVVATPPTQAAVSLIIDLELRRIGVEPGVDVELVARAGHTDCLTSVVVGEADACVTAPVPLQEFEEDRGEQLTVLARSERYPHIGWVARPGLDPALADEVVRFLHMLDTEPGGRAILDQVGAPAYVPIADDDYDPVRTLSAGPEPTP